MKTKTGLLNLKINPRTRAEFKIAADLRGATMSSLIHQYIFQVIREEKGRHPEAFTDVKIGEAEKESSSPKITRSSVRERDWIDEALDTAFAFDGKPLSEKTREKLRKILEEDREKETKKESP